MSLAEHEQMPPQNRSPSQPGNQSQNQPGNQLTSLDQGVTRDGLRDGFNQQLQPDQKVETREGEKKLINPLGLLKEEFSQLTGDFLNIFKDKDARTADRPIGAPAGRDGGTAFGQWRDLASGFNIGLANDFKTRTDKDNRTSLSLFKEDVSQLRDDLSNIFRKGFSRERDRSPATRGDVPKIKVGETRTEPTEDGSPDVLQDMDSVGHAGVRRTLGDQESVQTSRAEQDEPMEEEEEEEKGEENEGDGVGPSTGLRCGPPLRLDGGDTVEQPGVDLRALRQFACNLTFDPDTANPELLLSDGNTTVTRCWSALPPPAEHPDRFRLCPQVLCREGLLDRAYWEVEWSGGADVGASYNRISRDGTAADSLMGHNGVSWSLECSRGGYTACHHRRRYGSTPPRPGPNRVGLYLDFHAGSLSFYGVSGDAAVHLHTFNSIFTEPLYPGFWVWAGEGSVRLCRLQKD